MQGLGILKQTVLEELAAVCAVAKLSGQVRVSVGFTLKPPDRVFVWAFFENKMLEMMENLALQLNTVGVTESG